MNAGGIIFDFNGTLIFDTDAHERAWHKLIPEIRGSGFSGQEFKDHVHGRTNREIFSYVLGRPLSEADALPYGERKESLYREFLVQDPVAGHLIPGTVAFFDLLKREGVPMAIATASPASNIAFYRNRFNLERWFAEDRIVFADGTLPGKPHPALFLRAVERLGVPAGDVIVFEDSTLGVQAAQAAGVGRIIGVCPDAAARAVLERFSIHRIVSDFTGLDLSVFA